MSDHNVMTHRERAELDVHITGHQGEDDPRLDDEIYGDAAYAGFVESMFVKRNRGDEGMLHSILGVAGEVGELVDAIKKHWVYGKPIDHENVIEELGDIEFYLAAFRGVMGIARAQTIDANLWKLRDGPNARYKNGYTDAAAIARADKAVNPGAGSEYAGVGGALEILP